MVDLMNTTDYTWNGLNLKLKGLVEAREYLRQFKDMSVVIRLDNLKDFELLTKAKFKMHGLKRIKIVDGLKHPKKFFYDYTQRNK